LGFIIEVNSYLNIPPLCGRLAAANNGLAEALWLEYLDNTEAFAGTWL
jgi:hypothetical protein